jgi:hypothetical protein
VNFFLLKSNHLFHSLSIKIFAFFSVEAILSLLSVGCVCSIFFSTSIVSSVASACFSGLGITEKTVSLFPVGACSFEVVCEVSD